MRFLRIHLISSASTQSSWEKSEPSSTLVATQQEEVKFAQFSSMVMQLSPDRELYTNQCKCKIFRTILLVEPFTLLSTIKLDSQLLQTKEDLLFIVQISLKLLMLLSFMSTLTVWRMLISCSKLQPSTDRFTITMLSLILLAIEKWVIMSLTSQVLLNHLCTSKLPR